MDPIFHIAQGIEESREEAVEKALNVAGMYATWVAAMYAKAYHHNTRAGMSTIAGPPASHEFLYRDVYDPAARQWISTPHRIVRRTGKYIYVAQWPDSANNPKAGWVNGEQPTYRLDRQALEQQGYAFIPATASPTDQEEPVFFIFERNQILGGQVASCLEILQLSWPCTMTEVQEAYRRLVKNAHPDGGGSHEKFIELQTAYQQALRLCG
jgi:hypothetical protein